MMAAVKKGILHTRKTKVALVLMLSRMTSGM